MQAATSLAAVRRVHIIERVKAGGIHRTRLQPGVELRYARKKRETGQAAQQGGEQSCDVGVRIGNPRAERQLRWLECLPHAVPPGRDDRCRASSFLVLTKGVDFATAAEFVEKRPQECAFVERHRPGGALQRVPTVRVTVKAADRMNLPFHR